MWFTIVILLDLAALVYVPLFVVGVPGWIYSMLFVLYVFVWDPPHSRRFRAWKGWRWITERYFNVQIQGPGRELLVGERDRFPPSGYEQKYIFAIHPHGSYAVSLMAGIGLSEKCVDVRPVGTSLLFRIPVIREIVALGGTIHARARDMRNTLALSTTYALAMCPGGMRELTMRGDAVKQRQGFLRVAAQSGVEVVPVWAPDERSMYSMYLPLGNFFLDRGLLYPWPVVAWGKRWLRFWPARPESGETRLIVGEPIRVDPERIGAAEDQFYAALDQLKKQARGEGVDGEAGLMGTAGGEDHAALTQ